MVCEGVLRWLTPLLIVLVVSADPPVSAQTTSGTPENLRGVRPSASRRVVVAVFPIEDVAHVLDPSLHACG